MAFGRLIQLYLIPYKMHTVTCKTQGAQLVTGY